MLKTETVLHCIALLTVIVNPYYITFFFLLMQLKPSWYQDERSTVGTIMPRVFLFIHIHSHRHCWHPINYFINCKWNAVQIYHPTELGIIARIVIHSASMRTTTPHYRRRAINIVNALDILPLLSSQTLLFSLFLLFVRLSSFSRRDRRALADDRFPSVMDLMVWYEYVYCIKNEEGRTEGRKSERTPVS